VLEAHLGVLARRDRQAADPLVLRWAKALKHFVDKVPVTIFDDELIVGRRNTWLGY
jgi:hypothetical protein